MHGRPTVEPGRWSNTRRRATCGNDECTKLAAGNWPETTHALECTFCKEERRTRKLVATEPTDQRFKYLKFMTAAMIVPNNDVKVYINKRRAEEFASVHKKQIT